MKQIEVFRLRDVVGNVPACTQCILTPLSDKCDAAKCTSQGKPMAVSQVTYEPAPLVQQDELAKVYGGVAPKQPSVDLNALLRERLGSPVAKTPTTQQPEAARHPRFLPALAAAYGKPKLDTYKCMFGTAFIAEQLRNDLVSGDTAWLYNLPITAYLCGKALHYSVALTGEFWKFTAVKCETAEQAIEVCQKMCHESRYHRPLYMCRNITYKEFMSCV